MKTIVSSAMALALVTIAPARAQEPPARDTALIVIDIQGFYFENGSLPLTGSVEAARQARRAIDAARSRRVPVIHVRHVPASVKIVDGEPADAQYRIRPEVAPAPGEKVISKHYANSFRGTDLLDHLRANAVKRLVIVGMQTHMCVEAASRAATDLGFDVVVVHDACATRPLEFGGRTVPADMVHAGALAAINGTYGRVVSVAALLKELQGGLPGV
jgi:nicotinamidase-related amidase